MRKSFVAVFIISLFFCLNPLFAQNAPDFKLNDISGKEVSFSSLKGNKPVILFFWTTWCPYCRAELKELMNLSGDFKKDGVELLVIDVGEEKYKVESFLKARSLNLNVLLDNDSSVSQSYELLGVPTYVFITKAGEIALKDNSFSKDAYRLLITK
ncbi:MAG: TlpA disulfide reductase family protein [Candidatus Omnitrophica bacterium]|nr:TlpA disulfide reductase family protein [Candidatus Omnitrophota bacterium]